MSQANLATVRTNAYGAPLHKRLSHVHTSSKHDEELAYLDFVASGRMSLRLQDEVSLANTCLHYLKAQHGDDGFALRVTTRYYLGVCKEQKGHCERLVGIVEKLVPAETAALGLSYVHNLDD